MRVRIMNPNTGRQVWSDKHTVELSVPLRTGRLVDGDIEMVDGHEVIIRPALRPNLDHELAVYPDTWIKEA